MITKEDILGYLENLLSFELKAQKDYKELAMELNDVELKREFEALSRHESEHACKVSKMQKIIRN